MDTDPVAQAEAILQEAEASINAEAEMAEKQVQLLQYMTGLTHEQAHRAYMLYTHELTRLARKGGVTVKQVQESLGQTHCLIILGMVSGGMHCETDIKFGTPEEDGDF